MIGELLCFFGLHKWQPIPGTEGFRYVSKWQRYETAKGRCSRSKCKQTADIQKEIWY